jgi:predicted ester cyclase
VSLDPVTEHLSVWRWLLRGTNTGSYRGAPATGRSLTLPGCEFLETRGGKLHQVDGYFDRLTILAQLGLTAAPAAPAAD